MSRDDLEKIDDRAISAWDTHNVDEFVGLFADGFIWHDWTLPEPIRDKAGARAYFSGWISAFPDFRLRRTARVVGDDTFATELEFTGTNTGPLAVGGGLIPATNKKVTGRGTYIARVGGGKIVEFRSHPDLAGMMAQLGLMPQK